MTTLKVSGLAGVEVWDAWPTGDHWPMIAVGVAGLSHLGGIATATVSQDIVHRCLACRVGVGDHAGDVGIRQRAPSLLGGELHRVEQERLKSKPVGLHAVFVLAY